VPASILEVDRLKRGFVGISPTVGSAHAEACLVCMDQHHHTSGIHLQVSGDFLDSQVTLEWNDTLSQQIADSWNDLTIATEWAACGIAFLLVEALLGYTVIRQARKGHGFDYWIGEDNGQANLLQEKAVLEVSGILRASNESMIRSRVNQKLIRLNETELEAYVVVIEFSRPLSWIEAKS